MYGSHPVQRFSGSKAKSLYIVLGGTRNTQFLKLRKKPNKMWERTALLNMMA